MSKGWSAAPQVNVLTFGAKGDGVHDDASSIQQAIDSLPSTGGAVVIPYGTFLVGHEIQVYKQKVAIVGQGIATILQATSLTQNMFVFGDGGSTTYADLAIRHMKLTASGQKTAGTAIKLNKCFKVWIEDVFIEKQYRGIHVLNSTQTWMVNLPIRDTKENGITIESALNSGYDWYIIGAEMDNPDVTNVGVGINWLGGENGVILGCDVINFVTGFNIDAAAGQECRWAYFTGAVFDTCTDNGIHVGNTSTGNTAGLTFVNCWTGSCTNYGVLVDKNGSGYVQGIRFIGHKTMNNGLAGFRLGGGLDVHIADSDIISNSATSSGTRHGAEVAEAVSSWSVRGCRITNGYGHGASQQNGINVDVGASDDYIIEGNDLQGNAGSAISNGATGTTRIVRNNLGYVTENKGTATVASGQTTIAVNHGLSVTPALTDIQVTPTLMSNAAKFWITTPTSTQFTINVDADPGAGTATFVWQAEVI